MAVYPVPFSPDVVLGIPKMLLGPGPAWAIVLVSVAVACVLVWLARPGFGGGRREASPSDRPAPRDRTAAPSPKRAA